MSKRKAVAGSSKDAVSGEWRAAVARAPRAVLEELVLKALANEAVSLADLGPPCREVVTRALQLAALALVLAAHLAEVLPVHGGLRRGAAPAALKDRHLAPEGALGRPELGARFGPLRLAPVLEGGMGGVGVGELLPARVEVGLKPGRGSGRTRDLLL